MSRFVLIGLDGAEPSLVEPWMDEGRLPHLARLREKGSYLRLASTIPPATFPAWTTCVTGVNPGRHGVFDFTEMARGAYAVRFVNATYRRAPALWNVLSDAGKRVGVLSVPATYPPEPVNGFMVSGFDSPVCTRIDRSFVYPSAFYPEVREWRFADFQQTHIGSGWHDRALPRLLEGIARKEDVAARLLAREPWDFFMAVFGESDAVAHHFWMFHDSASPRHRPGHEDAIRRVYERLDAAVGRLVEVAGEGATIGVVSDHGAGGAGVGVVHLNNWLAERGYLRFWKPRRGALKDLALAVTPARWQGTLFRAFRGAADLAESRARFAGIDWDHTRAWSEELDYFPSIRVNLRGREPCGQVDREHYDGFCADLCRDLESWEPIRKAWRRDELYAGDYVDRAPDIVLEIALANGYSYSCLRSRGGPGLRRLEPREYIGGKGRGMNGSHRPTGIFFLSKRVTAGAARIEDVAPSVLAEIGVPAPPMDGTALLGEPGDAGQAAYARQERAYSPEQERVVAARLRGLGYFE